MKTTVTKPVEIDIATVLINVPVRYGDEDIPFDFPLRNGDVWKAYVNIDTGIIRDWPAGKTGDMHMKVCDSGEYTLFDPLGSPIAERSDYVPNGLIPGEYGDYISLKIGANGKITNWPKHPKFTEFFETPE